MSRRHKQKCRKKDWKLIQEDSCVSYMKREVPKHVRTKVLLGDARDCWCFSGLCFEFHTEVQ